MNTRISGNSGRRLGIAAEHRVVSELVLRGYDPLRPTVDNGTDIMLPSGVKIQVKASRLRSHWQYEAGAYIFNLRYASNWAGKKGKVRDWTKFCDFLILWAFDEDRFFVVPATSTAGSIWIVHRGNKLHAPDPEIARRLADQGMTVAAVAREMGVCHKTAKSMIHRLRPSRKECMTNRILQFESRWDLLDVNSAVEKLVESAEPVSVPKEN